jgi:hypothetical protein
VPLFALFGFVATQLGNAFGANNAKGGTCVADATTRVSLQKGGTCDVDSTTRASLGKKKGGSRRPFLFCD